MYVAVCLHFSVFNYHLSSIHTFIKSVTWKSKKVLCVWWFKKKKNKKTFLSGRLLKKYLNRKLKLLWSSLCMPLNLASNTCYLFRNSELCQRWLQSFAVIVCRCLWLYEQKLAMYPSPVWLEAFCLTLHSCRSIVCQCMVCILLISVHVLYVYAHIGKNTYNIQSLHFWSIYFLP